MGIKNLDDLRAYHRAREFKLEVYRLVDGSPQAQQDWKFRSQLMESAVSNEMNIREGFSRFLAGEIVQFLSIALASLSEAVGRLTDGIDRRYFTADDCARAFVLGEASKRTTLAWQQSLVPFTRRNSRRNARASRHAKERSQSGPGRRTAD
jgi:four helix bundle protein